MPTLSLCMIVKNEEQFLEQCLNSVKNLVDEIIIVDTGSTDQTKQIARKFTDKVFDFEWCNDFSAARNESLKHASGEWILILDADEIIAKEDHEKIKELIQNPETVGYILIQRNYFKKPEDLEYSSSDNIKVKGTNEGEIGFISSEGDPYQESKNTAGWLPTPIIRLFKNLKEVAFSGIVHEDVSPSLKGKITKTEIPIHHFGHFDILNRKKKREEYEKLAQKKADEEKDYYAYYELGRQYLGNKKTELAREMFLRSLSLNENFWVSWFNLGSLDLIENKLDSAIESLKKAKILNPKAVAIYSNLGVAYSKKRDFQKAIENFIGAIKLNSQDASAYKNLGICYHEAGNQNAAYQAFKKAIELNPEYAKEVKLG